MMRPRYSLALALCLALLIVIGLVRNFTSSEKTLSSAANRERQLSRQPLLRVKPTRPTKPTLAYASASSSAARAQPAVTQLQEPQPGLQLSPAVPLPAAAIAQSDPALLTAAATALREQITTQFYQDLAASFGPNATIQPGPAVTAALARANESYRSFFGDAAYQKQLLNSALEVRLPD
jgi:type IV secretory pathway VirJ component